VIRTVPNLELQVRRDLAQGRINRAVAASNNFRATEYVQARDRAARLVLAVLNAYRAGQANQVAQLLEENVELADRLADLEGGEVLRA
jgi:hypothetical protein